MTWCAEGANPTTVIRRGQHDRKNIFVICFRMNEFEFIHIIESGNSITDGYYKSNYLKSLFSSIRRKRPNAGLRCFKLHDDNARPHQTDSIKTFLQEERVMILNHPPYVPDLNSSDFWLLGYLK